MLKNFEGEFEMFDSSFRRLRNGDKLKIVFEMEDDIDTEKQLIEFRRCDVNLIVFRSSNPEKEVMSGIFEVFDVRVRNLRNGDKLSLVFETGWNKDLEIKTVGLRKEDCIIKFERVQKELDFEDDENYLEEYEQEEVEL